MDQTPKGHRKDRIVFFAGVNILHYYQIKYLGKVFSSLLLFPNETHFLSVFSNGIIKVYLIFKNYNKSLEFAKKNKSFIKMKKLLLKTLFPNILFGINIKYSPLNKFLISFLNTEKSKLYKFPYIPQQNHDLLLI